MTLSFILDDFLPALQLGQTGDEEENIFNEITVEERRARIDSIIRYIFLELSNIFSKTKSTHLPLYSKERQVRLQNFCISNYRYTTTFIFLRVLYYQVPRVRSH
jgi:hypothetical protein